MFWTSSLTWSSPPCPWTQYVYICTLVRGGADPLSLRYIYPIKSVPHAPVCWWRAGHRDAPSCKRFTRMCFMCCMHVLLAPYSSVELCFESRSSQGTESVVMGLRLGSFRVEKITSLLRESFAEPHKFQQIVFPRGLADDMERTPRHHHESARNDTVFHSSIPLGYDITHDMNVILTRL